MPATDWPNSYGFSISGNGPCFVISVSREGQAYRAGISPGKSLIKIIIKYKTSYICLRLLLFLIWRQKYAVGYCTESFVVSLTSINF